MTNKNNFKWLNSDIDNTLVLKVVYKAHDKFEEYGVFNVIDVLETPCDELEVDNGNINDLTNLLTLGIVRFINVVDSSDVIEIPFKKLYLLYKNAFRLPNVIIPFSDLDGLVNIDGIGEVEEGKLIPFSELDTFSVIDGTIRNDLLLFSAVVSDVSVDLISVLEIAYKYDQYDMQEKFNALKQVDKINHHRIINDQKEKILK